MATQKARLEKKLELENLYIENDTMKERFQVIVQALEKSIPSESKSKVIENFTRCIKSEQGKYSPQDKRKID